MARRHTRKCDGGFGVRERTMHGMGRGRERAKEVRGIVDSRGGLRRRRKKDGRTETAVSSLTPPTWQDRRSVCFLITKERE